jgi:hypothetical protein
MKMHRLVGLGDIPEEEELVDDEEWEMEELELEDAA